ncbi:DUF1294 domain-containing protein [Rossellomorea marisflavi]|uniref:DUF1294 domain-containing protein n=1 Tax=Rossellomorea marisflavi TaxID=189381 RepID=UPI00345B345F
METWIIALNLYLIVINIAGFVLMGRDKEKARRGEYRISERTLWQVAILGGSVGSYFGMRIHRHKTKHVAFRLGFPLLVILHGGLYIWFVL